MQLFTVKRLNMLKNLDPFQLYILKRKNVNSDEVEFLKTIFEKKDYQSGQILLQRGQISNCLYFVQKGILKTSFFNEDDKEFINGIAIENNFCTSVSSWSHAIPSNEEIVALEDAEIYEISRENFNLLLEIFPVYKDIYIQILQDYLFFMSWRIESISLHDAKQKYDSLMKIYPKLFLRLPNKTMAQYLGISQETLSRMKSRK